MLKTSLKTLPPHEEHDVVYPSAWHFILVHLALVGILFTGVTGLALTLCVALYALRMFAVTAGYHRYFSHRSFKTSRVGQFVLAWLCQMSAQRGAVWWAAKHRLHHKYSDTPLDPHSPVLRGFWFAHVGWIFAPRAREADYSVVPDLTQYPELMWLNRRKYLPAVVLAVAVYLAAGWSGLFVGFFLSTVLLYHCTFFINSMAHVIGKQRYVTGDDSRNNWFLALITFGEGWHNNHHHYQSSTRQGFRWWEVDITYYLLKLLSLVGVVWDLRAPPAEVVANERRLARTVVDKVARQLAESFPLEDIAAQVREAWANSHRMEDLAERMREARTRAEAALSGLHMPEIPSVDELKERAREMFRDTPSLDAIVERSREFMIEAVSRHVVEGMPAPA